MKNMKKYKMMNKYENIRKYMKMYGSEFVGHQLFSYVVVHCCLLYLSTSFVRRLRGSCMSPSPLPSKMQAFGNHPCKKQ